MDAYLLNAFTRADGGGGNPAAVVLDAEPLDERARQALAAEYAVPETAFVSAAPGHAAAVQFFTPTRPIPHCGHATVAAFSLLRDTGRIATGLHSKLSVEGPRPVRVETDRVWLGQSAPRFNPLRERVDDLVAALGLDDAARLAAPPMRVSVGNWFLHVWLDGEQALRDLRPDMAAIRRLSEAVDAVGLYIAHVAPDEHRDATTRMFAPGYGIDEEAATGMAAGGLGALMAYRAGKSVADYRIEQGRWMAAPSPSRIEVEVDAGTGEVWTGGSASLRGALALRERAA